MVIPVSCTEHGRWFCTSDKFTDYEAILTHTIHRSKSRSVHASLWASASYESNQGRLWNEIHRMSMVAGVSSPTSVMRDVYEERRSSLEDYTAA